MYLVYITTTMQNHMHERGGGDGEHIAGDQSARCIWAVGMSDIATHGKAGTLALGPDGRRKAGRHAREKECVGGKIEKERWIKIDTDRDGQVRR